MGEDGDDPQRIKKISAAAYDYENDPRWADYWSNVLIPPHMASQSNVVDHFKRKFYQRFIDPDFVVEPMSSNNSSQSARASASSSSPPMTENARPRNQGSSAGTSVPPSRSANSLRLDRRTIHFSVNAWVLVVAVLGMLPVVPRALSNKAYRLSLLGTTCSSLYSLYTLYGGGFSALVKTLRKQCIELLAEIEARLDFEDELPYLDPNILIENIQGICHEVQHALDTADYDKLLQSGLQIAIIGRPNVGKSSLLNAWSKNAE